LAIWKVMTMRAKSLALRRGIEHLTISRSLKGQGSVTTGSARRLPKTVVIGAGGYLGRHLLAAHREAGSDALGVDVVGEWPHLLDLAAPDIRPLRLRESGFEYAIIAAAVAGLARCEQDKEYTRARNVTGTLELARQLVQEGVTPIFFSTDAVFDGREGGYREGSPTNPLNEYGAQKAEVERRLPEVSQGRYLICRLGKVFGLTRGDRTLLDEMAGRLTQGQEVAAARDMIFCPVLVHDVIRAVLELQTVGATGLFNVCGLEVWSRFDLAQAVARALAADPALVRGVSLDDLREPFGRPKRTDMVCGKLRATIDLEFQPMAACIAALAKQYQKGTA
jgi:dTDP-4-dehydrorhamnose reductase